MPTPQRLHLDERASGLLLHPTSLPGPCGIGDLGPAACRFVDFLAAAGQRWWQMLPVGPVDNSGSPYNSDSAFAGNPLLISLDRLRQDGLLDRRDVQPSSAMPPGRVNYPAVTRIKLAAMRRAFEAFKESGGPESREFRQFQDAQHDWLGGYALFHAKRAANRGRPWIAWPKQRRWKRLYPQVAHVTHLLDDVQFACFLQFQFQRQWDALKAYANERGVGLIGDIPIFVAHNSADVWANPELFDLTADGRPRTISGVPPDMFSRTGQLWRHPHYRWRRHQATGFAWWLARFRRMFALFDGLRIDHFLGFSRVWAVPGRAKTAQHGRWVKTPGEELFTVVRRRLGRLEIIAEDLGVATPAAVALRERFGFPGMRLLHFAFGNDEGDRYNQPHTFPHNCVVYPGTHDNETTAGWFERLRREHRRQRRAGMTAYERVLRYLGTSERDYVGRAAREIHWDIIRLALLSPANTAIIPVQDILGLGNEARMNVPATTRGNWQWQMLPGQFTPRLARRLRDQTDACGRLRTVKRSTLDG